MTELKPCPFCGGEAIIVNEAIRENVYGGTIIGTAIGCRNCECHMFYRNRELAIEAWNKRVPPTINDIEEYIENTHKENMEMVAKLKRKYEVKPYCDSCVMYFPDDGCMAGLVDEEVKP